MTSGSERSWRWRLHDGIFRGRETEWIELTGAQFTGGIFWIANFKNADLRGAV